MEDHDLHWLAGLLEGEGSFLAGPPSEPNKPRISIEMRDEDVVRRVADLLGSACTPIKPREAHHSPCFKVLYKGRKAVVLMEQLRPLMGARRQAQIDRALASFDPNYKKKITPEQAGEIKQRFADGERADSLADEFGISKWYVYAIHQGRRRTGP